MRVNHDGGFLILLGIASLFDGLVRTLTFGIICPSISLDLQVWKMNQIIQQIRKSNISSAGEE